MKGKVFLVGAGPGDVGLLTIKGREILEQAQVVVYDSLVGQSLFCLIPEDAEMIDVGKHAGSHTMEQDEINRLLLDKALDGKRVVRLKGGDPFIFGRGGEELELLTEKKIPFEIVPGVTSAFSVPLYNGIPITHRDYASSVHVFTGHRKQGETLQLDYEALAQLTGSLVFLMSVSTLEEICQGLLAAGMDGKTPAAVLQQGTLAGQKKIISNLANLCGEVQRQGVQTPAILVVGEVCTLGNRFGWYEKLPLFGKRILLTRPRERSRLLADRLRLLGAEVLEAPTIRLERIENNRKLWEEFAHLFEYQYLVFTSPAGVEIFFDELKETGHDIRSIGGAQIAAIGKGTQKALAARGLICDWIPDIYDGQHLGILLGEICKDGDRILIPRAAQGNPQLVQEIEKRVKAEITEVSLYRTTYEKSYLMCGIEKQFEQGLIHMAVFTSSSTVRGFVEATEGLDFGLVLAVCIGVQTEETAQKYGMKTVMAKRATIDNLVETIMEVGKNGIAAKTAPYAEK